MAKSELERTFTRNSDSVLLVAHVRRAAAQRLVVHIITLFAFRARFRRDE